MAFPNRPIAFVLAASNHGSMIVNRNDYHMVDARNGYGVGFQILGNSCFDQNEIQFALVLLDCRRKHFGDGIVAIDGGANIGVHSVEWAPHMYGWGSVLGFDAQEIVYYALAGNIAVNNCLNARVRLSALGEFPGELVVPQPDYFRPASFGSLELRRRDRNEFIGQTVSYETTSGNVVPMINLDSLRLARLDLVKLDVEGMELEVLRGARRVLERYRPVMLIEVIKSDRTAIEAFLIDLGYRTFPAGLNVLAVHSTDPTLEQIACRDGMTMVVSD